MKQSEQKLSGDSRLPVRTGHVGGAPAAARGASLCQDPEVPLGSRHRNPKTEADMAWEPAFVPRGVSFAGPEPQKSPPPHGKRRSLLPPAAGGLSVGTGRLQTHLPLSRGCCPSPLRVGTGSWSGRPELTAPGHRENLMSSHNGPPVTPLHHGGGAGLRTMPREGAEGPQHPRTPTAVMGRGVKLHEESNM